MESKNDLPLLQAPRAFPAVFRDTHLRRLAPLFEPDTLQAAVYSIGKRLSDLTGNDYLSVLDGHYLRFFEEYGPKPPTIETYFEGIVAAEYLASR